MSAREFFQNPKGIITSKDLDKLGTADAESADQIKERQKQKDAVVPNINWATASNFAMYGSAEKYYMDAMHLIVNQWPYDGSEAEQQKFLNDAGNVAKWVLEEKYPRTNGYAILGSSFGTLQSYETNALGGYGAPATASYEYIRITGGPHTASGGMPVGSLATTFTGSNYYDTNIYSTNKALPSGRLGSRASNLRTNVDNGVTVEFWLKKPAWSLANTQKEVIFDLWNGAAKSAGNYGRFRVELTGTATGSPFRVTLLSGSHANTSGGGFYNTPIGDSTITTGSMEDWNHYAITVANSGSKQQVRLFVNGNLNHTVGTGSATLKEITGSLTANIGALRTAPSGAYTLPTQGWGKLSASMDEFRFWKEARSHKDIGRNWFTQVRGGSNTDIANATLGAYYKFNEGIIGNPTTDSVVLDYSGRISNGQWVGYPGSASRNTGSAIVEASAADKEFEDPIIYSGHSLVSSLSSSLAITGSDWDSQNNSSLLTSLPHWIAEDDEVSGDGTLDNMIQLIGSYFDNMHLMIDQLPRIKSPGYMSSSHKPYPFASKLISNLGISTPDLFVDANVLNRMLQRDEDRNFKEDIDDVKNLIYQNIYNNLTYIFKTKGTTKSIRNLLHCFGIDEDVIRLNLYANNADYDLRDSYRETVVKKRYVNFNDPDKFSSTVYQYADPDNSNTVGFISGSSSGSLERAESHLGFTAECEAIFPLKPDVRNSFYFDTPFQSGSIFGMHSARGETPAATGWAGTVSAEAVDALKITGGTVNHNDAFTVLVPTAAGGLGVTATVVARTSMGSTPSANQIHWHLTGNDLNKITNLKLAINGTSDTSKVKFGSGITNGSTVGIKGLTAYAGVTSTESYASLAAANAGTAGNDITITDTVGTVLVNEGALTSNKLTGGEDDSANFQVYLVKPSRESADGYFSLSSSIPFPISEMTTSLFKGVYDNEKWNLSVSISPENYGITNLVTGSSANAYKLEFFGANVRGGVVEDSFYKTQALGSASAEKFMRAHKRMYVGCHRTDFTGGVLQRSDAKISGVRYWASYLPTSSIIAHAKDPRNYGVEHPYRSPYLGQKTIAGPNTGSFVPHIDTLALHWDFGNVISASSDAADPSAADSNFYVNDISSGSSDLTSRAGAGWGYSWLGNITKKQHSGKGDFFLPPESGDLNAIDFNYVGASRLQPPESVDTNDMIQITREVDEAKDFSTEDRVSDYFYSIEKSMYRTISEEMLNFFGSIVDFNNLIGEPVNRYRPQYKDIEKLKQLFFDRVGSTPRLDKYIDYYKWIDSSIAEFIRQLVPASANISDDVQTMIESHVLERNKYWSKFPTIEFKAEDPEARLFGISEMLYDWEHGHAPVPDTAATATWTFTDKPNEATTITLTDTEGTSVVFEVDNDGDGGAGSNTEMDPATNNAAGMSAILISKVNASALKITATTGGEATGEVLLTQDVKGEDGNQAIALSNYSNWNANTSATFPTSFTGGSTPENKNALWWGERASRNHAKLRSSNTVLDRDRNVIRDRITTHISSSGIGSVTEKGGTAYRTKKYPRRVFTKVYNFNTYKARVYGGGINFNKNKKLGFIRSRILKNAIGASALAVSASQVYNLPSIDDVQNPSAKKMYTFKAFTDANQNNEYTNSGKGHLIAPFNIVSSSVSTGYQSDVVLWSPPLSGSASAQITNLHTDAYGNDQEVPMQGPFAEKYVGGYLNRHADINYADSNKSLDVQDKRAEAWDFSFSNTTNAQSAIIFSRPAGNNPSALWSREELAKRPLNIRNIKQTTGSTTTSPTKIGNYTFNYDVVQISGRTQNNRFLKRSYSNDDTIGKSNVAPLPGLIHSGASALPATTNVHTLIAVRPEAANDHGPSFITSPTTVGVSPSLDRDTSLRFAQQKSGSTAATAEDGLKITGGTVQHNDAFTVLVPTAAGGLGVTATVLARTSMGSTPSANQIHYHFSGNDANKIANLKLAINGTSDASKVKFGSGITDGATLGIKGLTASEGTSGAETFVNLTADNTGDEGNDIAITDTVGTVHVNESALTSGKLAGGTAATSATVFTLPRYDLTGSDSVIVSRFSSPGGPEQMSRGFLDKNAEEYSVYNALPYRNLSVLGSGSGEAGGGVLATATITVADGDAVTGMTEGEKVTITSTDGTVKVYRLCDDTLTTVSTGVELLDASDTGAGTAADDGDVAVVLNIASSEASQNDFLVQLKAAIEHANGHNGKITVSAVPDEANGNQAITLTQAITGRAGNTGNTTITDDISQTTIVGFTGGTENLPTMRVSDHLNTNYGLRTHLARYSGQFGHDQQIGSVSSTTYVTNPSFHKVNRNRLKRIELSGTPTYVPHNATIFDGIAMDAAGGASTRVRDDRIEIEDHNSLTSLNYFNDILGTDGTNKCTIAAWIRWDGIGDHSDLTAGERGWQSIFCAGFMNKNTFKAGRGLMFGISGSEADNAKLFFHRAYAGGTSDDRSLVVKTSAKTINVGVWTLVAVTFDGTSNALGPVADGESGVNQNDGYQDAQGALPTFYVWEQGSDYAKYASGSIEYATSRGGFIGDPRFGDKADTAAVTFAAPNELAVMIGNGAGTSASGSNYDTSTFDGAIAECMIWDGILNDAEVWSINRNYDDYLSWGPQALTESHTAENANLSGWWKLGVGDTAVVSDVSTGSADGRAFDATASAGALGLQSSLISHYPTYVTSSKYDNGYINHMIPRSDMQYSWITASLAPSGSRVLGYAPYSGRVSSSAVRTDNGVLKRQGYENALNFISSSELVSVVSDGERKFAKDKSNVGSGDKGLMFTDFVGLNTNIREPIVSSLSDSTNLLGFSSLYKASEYINIGSPKEETAGDFATATITVADGDAASGMAEKETIVITSTDGTEKTYCVIDDNATTVATGAILAADSDTGASTAGSALVGAIAVAINLTGSASTQNTFLVQLKAAIEHANGHNGKITVSAVPGQANGAQLITLTQVAGGTAGNVAITDDISQTTLAGFTGGTEAQQAADPRSEGGGKFATGSFINSTIAPALNTEESGSPGLVGALNGILLHRNGPYGYPSWKQVRTGEHPIARYQRKNNIFSIVRAGEVVNFDSSAPTVKSEFGTIDVFERVTPVSTKYRPIEHAVTLYTVDDLSDNNDSDNHKYYWDGAGQSVDVVISTTYGNDLVYFDDAKVDASASVSLFARDSTSFDFVNGQYLDGAIYGVESAIQDLTTITYKEIVYPSSENMFDNRVRGRYNYTNNFWRSDRQDRATTTPATSTTQALRHSMWPLDAFHTFASGTEVSVTASGITAISGELMNTHTYYHNISASLAGASGTIGSPGTIVIDYSAINAVANTSPCYLRPHFLGATASVANGTTNIVASRLGNSSGHVDRNWAGSASIGFGYAEWQAPDFAGRYDVSAGQVGRSAWVTGSSDPWYKDYDSYAAELRAQAKDYSIVPEFRISDNIEFYVLQNQGNVLADQQNLFSIPGQDNSSDTFPQSSVTSSFYEIYSTSDFMKDFATIKSANSSVGAVPSKLTLTCRAAIKFLPYDGFYPAERTLALAKQFSSSYSNFVTYEGGIAATDEDAFTEPGSTLANERGPWRAFLQPMMAPGILFNSIKSGLAVDYPLMLTGSKIRKTKLGNSDYWGLGFDGVGESPLFDEDGRNGNNKLDPDNISFQSFNLGTFKDERLLIKTDSDIGNTASLDYNAGIWDYRIPFEAILNPEQYIANIPMIDHEPDPRVRIDVTASWAGGGNFLYKMMANNFCAEVSSFFLNNGENTKIQSMAESNMNLSVEAGKVYGARVKLRKSLNKSRAWDEDVTEGGGDVAKATITVADGDAVTGMTEGEKITITSTDGTARVYRLCDDTLTTIATGAELADGSDTGAGTTADDGDIAVVLNIATSEASQNDFLVQLKAAIEHANGHNGKITVSAVPTEANGNQVITLLQLVPSTAGNVAISDNISQTTIVGFAGGTDSSYAIKDTFAKTGSYNLPQDPRNQTGLQETFTMYSRPSAFGPAVWGRIHQKIHTNTYNTGSYNFHRESISGSAWGAMDSLEGYYWSFTPPYYDGEAWADLLFAPAATKTYTLEELMSEVKVQYWRHDPGIHDPNAGNFAAPKTLAEERYPKFTTNGMHSSSLYSGENINRNAMQINASLNLLSQETVPTFQVAIGKDGEAVVEDQAGEESKVWTIQPKFETPMFNFNATYNVATRASALTIPTHGSESMPVGMWHQFAGIENEEDRGIFMEINDIPQTWLQNHGWVRTTDIYQTSLSSVLTGADLEFQRMQIADNMKSLVDLVGFDSTPTKLGKVRESLTVEEAIVAVPFIEKSGEKSFFALEPNQVAQALGREFAVELTPAGASIMEQVSLMRKFIIPPTFDFVTNNTDNAAAYEDTVAPVAMYIFPFSYTFDQDDLSHIWQNVAPPCSKTFSLAEASISHDLLLDELMGYANDEEGEAFQDKVQWMVFKVKQRGKINYYETIAGGEDAQDTTLTDDYGAPYLFGDGDPGHGQNTDPNYGYNWPYDFFSIIEAAQIESEVQFVPTMSLVEKTDTQKAAEEGAVVPLNDSDATVQAAVGAPIDSGTSLAEAAAAGGTDSSGGTGTGGTTGTGGATTAFPQPDPDRPGFNLDGTEDLSYAI